MKFFLQELKFLPDMTTQLLCEKYLKNIWQISCSEIGFDLNPFPKTFAFKELKLNSED